MDNKQTFHTDIDKIEPFAPADTQEPAKKILREQMLADTDKLLTDFAKDYEEMSR